MTADLLTFNQARPVEHAGRAGVAGAAPEPLGRRPGLDPRENKMTVAKRREGFEDLRAGQDDIPQAAGGRGWRAGLKYGAAPSWTPAIDISERPDAYVVTVEIPALRPARCGSPCGTAS